MGVEGGLNLLTVHKSLQILIKLKILIKACYGIMEAISLAGTKLTLFPPVMTCYLLSHLVPNIANNMDTDQTAPS